MPFPLPDEAAAATCDDADVEGAADGDVGALLALATGAAEVDPGGALDPAAVLAVLDVLAESEVGAIPRGSAARARRKMTTATAISASRPGSARST